MNINRRGFIGGSLAVLFAGCNARELHPTVGSKNFTEQLILGEIIAQAIEYVAKRKTEKRFYLASSYICHQAILAGRIDIYVEYTGTALAAILKDAPASDPQQVWNRVKNEYQSRFNLQVLPSMGFNNSFAMVMRGEDANRLRIRTLTDLAAHASQLRLGVGYEFLERRDGLPGLASTYGLKFAGAPRVMDLGLLYRAIQNKDVDIIAGANTDGLIAALGLTVLEDDRKYFPPYDAVPIVRPDCWQRYPAVQRALNSLAGNISAQEMRAMNYAVDGNKRDARDVAREFLAQKIHPTFLP